MKPSEKKLEMKVGFFVLIGIGLACAAVLILGGKQSIFTSVSHYYSHFAKIDGLVSGAKVGMGGLQVGVVSEVIFDPKTRDIRVRYSIEKKYAQWVRADSTVEIVTQGVLGDKYVSLNAGDPAQPLIPEDGDIVPGASKDLSNLFSSSEKLMLKITTVADSLDRVLGAFNRNNRADRFFENVSATSKNVSEISDKVNTAKLKSAIEHLNSILEKIDHGQGSLGAIINDPALYDDAKALVGQVNRNRIM
jgi:phospholipid/cholesterol/gamma-HCH transport system substrate-binding protein